MKIFAYILLLLLIISCEKTKLIPTTSESLNEKVSKFKGKKAVLINVWALWCEPCVEEFPMIVELSKNIKDLEVIFVSADFEDDLQNVVKFLNSHDIGPVSYFKKQKDEEFIQNLSTNWSGSLPFTMVFSKATGKIIESWEGKKPKERFISAVSKALNQNE